MIDTRKGNTIANMGEVVAVRELTPSVPKRREFFIDPEIHGHINVSEIKGKIEDHPPMSQYNTHVREVFPGDPDPAVVIEVIKEMLQEFKTSCSNNFHVHNSIIMRWINKLEDKE